MGETIVDVSDRQTAAETLRGALAGAGARDPRLRLVLVTKPGPTRTIRGPGGDRWQTNWLSSAEQFLDSLAGTLPAVEVTRCVHTGSRRRALCREAERVDASTVVLGCRSGWFARLRTRVLARTIARRTGCDVTLAGASGGRTAPATTASSTTAARHHHLSLRPAWAARHGHHRVVRTTDRHRAGVRARRSSAQSRQRSVMRRALRIVRRADLPVEDPPIIDLTMQLPIPATPVPVTPVSDALADRIEIAVSGDEPGPPPAR